LTLSKPNVTVSTAAELMVASAATGTAGGAYSIPPASAASDAIPSSSTTYAEAPALDFFGNQRKVPANSPISIGAVEINVQRVISVAPTALEFGNVQNGQVSTTTTPAQPVIVRNNGSLPLTLSATAFTITGTNANQYSAAGGPTGTPCSNNLVLTNYGDTCTITVTFAPTSTGLKSASLNVFSNASNGTQVVTLTGTGQVPSATRSPAALTFAAQQTGTTSAPQPVTFTNTGVGPLTVTVSFSGANANNFGQTNNCGPSLGAGLSCTINVTFTPTATGNRSATLNINSAAGTQTVTLTGTGQAPSATRSPATLTFAAQQTGTTSAPQPVTLTNTGVGPLTVTSFVFSGANANNFAQTNNCGTSLPVSGSCTINVTFTPTAAGARSGTLTITDGAGTQPVTLRGTGVAASATLTGTAAFGNQQVGTTSAAHTFTYTNTGSGPITVSNTGVTLSGGNSTDYAIASNTCIVGGVGVTLAPAATCQIGVTFTPSATGSRTRTLTVIDTAGGAPNTTASLNGTGVAPSATLTGTAAFGSQQVGTPSAAHTFTYTNTGSAPITVSNTGVTLSGGNSTTDYAITSNTCIVGGIGVTLPASGTCQIGVTFTPSVTGSRTRTLTVIDTAGGAPNQTASLTGTGEQATVSITWNGGGTVGVWGTATGLRTFTVTNTGTAGSSLVVTALPTVANLTGGTQFAYTGGTCAPSTVLAQNQNCTVNVTRTRPGSSPFAGTGTLTGYDTGAATTTQVLNLTGT
jgi:hypothetical protein